MEQKITNIIGTVGCTTGSAALVVRIFHTLGLLNVRDQGPLPSLVYVAPSLQTSGVQNPSSPPRPLPSQNPPREGEGNKSMVFYFKARPDVGDYTIFMGLDKYENEDLIKYGFPEDIWFHVDKMSSAHVYLRLNKGNKVNNVDVVYTPWYNLKKASSMDVGQVGFHNPKIVRTVRVEKRINEIVNRLNKAKVERKPDLKAEREAVNAAERAERKVQLREKKRREDMERLENGRQADLRSYEGLLVPDKMTSNKQIAATNKSLQELEEDFM
ncbi:hypothetical protein ACLOJK_040268 [Asimina triloba]